MNAVAYKEYERRAYDAIAAAWTENVAANTAAYGRKLLEWLQPTRHSPMLDLACGSGDLGIYAATRFELNVTGVDLSEGLLGQARQRAEGIPNIRFYHGDAEKLPFKEKQFDYAACSLGVMFFPNTLKALAEIRRVLRPGGEASFVVWSRPRRASCIGVAATSLAQTMAPWYRRLLFRAPRYGTRMLYSYVERTIPGRGPSPMRFGRPSALPELLDRAGFAGRAVIEHTETWRYRDFDDYWERFILSTPGRAQHEKFSQSQIDEIRARMKKKCRAYTTADGLVFPMTALLIRAERSSHDR